MKLEVLLIQKVNPTVFDNNLNISKVLDNLSIKNFSLVGNSLVIIDLVVLESIEDVIILDSLKKSLVFKGGLVAEYLPKNTKSLKVGDLQYKLLDFNYTINNIKGSHIRILGNSNNCVKINIGTCNGGFLNFKEVNLQFNRVLGERFIAENSYLEDGNLETEEVFINNSFLRNLTLKSRSLELNKASLSSTRIKSEISVLNSAKTRDLILDGCRSIRLNGCLGVYNLVNVGTCYIDFKHPIIGNGNPIKLCGETKNLFIVNCAESSLKQLCNLDNLKYSRLNHISI